MNHGEQIECLRRRFAPGAFAIAFLAVLTVPLACDAALLNTANGFYGIWYANAPSGDQYAYKYSGGLGTYTHQTAPLAIYRPEVNRTYFTYGGTNGSGNTLKNYISYYDHDTGLVARPREVRHVGGTDNHKNATLSIDDDGYLWVFANSHGNSGSGNLYKSTQPWEIASFDAVPLPDAVFDNDAGNSVLAYTNPLYVPGEGHMLVWNQYDDERAAHVATSADGLAWDSQRLFKIAAHDGHYTLARRHENTIAVSADTHPGGLDNRTNLYYAETNDFSQTWTTAGGTPLTLPLTTVNNPALVHDYLAEDKLVYMKDIAWDDAGNPILLYLTVSDANGNGHRSGPQPGGRMLHTAHWTGDAWHIRDVVATDHNYDNGELFIEPDGSWRLIGPFIDGPQVFGTGGQVGVWESLDQGATWQFLSQWTHDTQFNHTYVRRPVDARDEFYAYWANGNAFAQSASRLFFATQDGDVYRLPTGFAGAFAAPELVWRNRPPLPGDLNLDGVVDIFDVNLVSEHWGEAGPDGDANGDGSVDIFDINLISEHWTTTDQVAVPEPATIALGLVALCGLALRQTAGSLFTARPRSSLPHSQRS